MKRGRQMDAWPFGARLCGRPKISRDYFLCRLGRSPSDETMVKTEAPHPDRPTPAMSVRAHALKREHTLNFKDPVVHVRVGWIMGGKNPQDVLKVLKSSEAWECWTNLKLYTMIGKTWRRRKCIVGSGVALVFRECSFTNQVHKCKMAVYF